MTVRGNYHTISGKIILEFARRFRAPFSAKDLRASLQEEGFDIGSSTLYRQLDQLSSRGLLHLSHDNDRQTLYFFTPPCAHEHHFYLQCTKCQRIFHVDCDEIQPFANHTATHHHFIIDTNQLFIPGVCTDCQNIKESYETTT